jgi:hypothetical protein
MQSVVRVASKHKRVLVQFAHRPRIITTLVYFHDLNNIPAFEMPAEAHLRRIGVEEIGVLREVWPVPLDKMCERLHNGHYCYAIYLGDRIAHYMWVQVGGRHWIKPAARHITIQDNDVVFYHVRVAEWARGQHLSVLGYTEVLRIFSKMGQRAAWVYTTMDNLPSQKTIQRSGWMSYTCFRALSWGTVLIAIP